MLLLGVDVGTQGSKAGLYTTDGVRLGEGYAEHAFDHLRPGWVEMDPDQIHGAVLAAIGLSEAQARNRGLALIFTEGVHAGSNGPLYYPREELEKTPAVWNHKPIVVYHPMEDGLATSACQPSVISSRKVGVILNTHFVPGSKGAPGKLVADAYLETSRLKEVDKRSGYRTKQMLVEHPTGASPVSITTEEQNGNVVVTEAAIISTARALFDGRVLVPR